MNNCTLTGRLTKDPVIKIFDSGAKQASFSLAVDRRFKRDTTDFIPCVCWGKLEETAEKYLKKGSLVGVVGSLEVRSYEKDGETRYIYEINVNEINFLGSKKEEAKPEEKKETPPTPPPVDPIEGSEYFQPSLDEEDVSQLPFDVFN